MSAAAPRASLARRYLGLELAGAKNHKTALAAMEHYPKEGKIFLLELYDRITPRDAPGSPHPRQSSDDALLELIREHESSHPGGIAALGVNVPLTLPACITCTRKRCPTPSDCSVSEVKWMREQTRRAARDPERDGAHVRALEFTPYTQRPVELWVRYHVSPELPEPLRFEIDETLGGNRAPLTARMNYLRRHLDDTRLLEVWPKLSIARLGQSLGITRRLLTSYRQVENGAHARLEILETLCERMNIFIYERDQNQIAESLSAFDAFTCALTALLADSGKTAPPPKNFPTSLGWVEYPSL